MDSVSGHTSYQMPGRDQKETDEKKEAVLEEKARREAAKHEPKEKDENNTEKNAKNV